MPNTAFEAFRDEAELDELGHLLNQSFGTTGDAEVSRKWAAAHGPDGSRVLRIDGSLAACLVRLPMGHFFGGRSVSTLGIAGVGVKPELRGQGHAKTLMREALLEARAQGFALSSLYASTFSLYRQLGYERAGTRFCVELDPRHLTLREKGATVRPLTEDDEPVARELYGEYAKLGSGLLDRSEDIWRRVSQPAFKPSNGILILEGDRATGYARWIQVEGEAKIGYKLVVSDHAVATSVAARRLLTFLADHATMANPVVWFGGPGEPLLSILDITEYTLSHWADWLIRFVHLPSAMEARGYPAGVSGELHFEIEDDFFDDHCGRFVLKVADGRGSFQAGGDGRIACSVRGLAPLYTGHLSPAQLRLTSWFEGDDESCALAQTLFSGPTPWMPDFF